MIQLPIIEVGSKSLKIYILCIVPDKDIIIYIGGGNKSHIGAISLGVPRKSITDKGVSSSASVVSVTGHKEDLLSRDIALKVSREFNCNVSVIAGIHLKDATNIEIDQLIKNTYKGINILISELKMICKEPH